MKVIPRTRRQVLATAGVIAGSLALPFVASAQSPIVIKFSHVVAPNTPKGASADFFAKRAAELTNGRVKVEVYPNSQLYKDKEELEALQLGSVQMLPESLWALPTLDGAGALMAVPDRPVPIFTPT